MSRSSAPFLLKFGAVVVYVSILAGCAPMSPTPGTNEGNPSASETPVAISTDDLRLVADESANPELQGFLDTWVKDGVTIAETRATDDELLVAFTDENENGLPDPGEPVMAQSEGDMSQIPKLATTETTSGVVTGRCFYHSYIVNTGDYRYRGETVSVGFVGLGVYTGPGAQACRLTLSLSKEAFPGEKWEGLLRWTYRGEPIYSGMFIWPDTTNAMIEIPLPSPGDVIEELYGPLGELAIVSAPVENHEQYPDDRIIVGSWQPADFTKSE